MSACIYLFDTNALSLLGKETDMRLLRLVEANRGQIRLSSIAWFELCYGAEKRKDLPQLEQRLARLRTRLTRVLPFDERAARAAAQVRAYLENLKPNAQPISIQDCLLAGHALALNAVIVTNNVREFLRVPGLRVDDWQAPRR